MNKTQLQNLLLDLCYLKELLIKNKANKTSINKVDKKIHKVRSELEFIMWGDIKNGKYIKNIYVRRRKGS